MEETERKAFEGLEKEEAEEKTGEAKEDNGKLVLESADGESIEFTVVATIYLFDDTYLIAHPEGLEDVKEDEALVLQVIKDGEDLSYRIEEDQDIVMMVFQEYYALFEENGDKDKPE